MLRVGSRVKFASPVNEVLALGFVPDCTGCPHHTCCRVFNGDKTFIGPCYKIGRLPNEDSTRACTLRCIPCCLANIEVCANDVPFLASFGCSTRYDSRITNALSTFRRNYNRLALIHGNHGVRIVAIGKVEVDRGLVTKEEDAKVVREGRIGTWRYAVPCEVESLRWKSKDAREQGAQSEKTHREGSFVSSEVTSEKKAVATVYRTLGTCARLALPRSPCKVPCPEHPATAVPPKRARYPGLGGFRNIKSGNRTHVRGKSGITSINPGLARGCGVRLELYTKDVAFLRRYQFPRRYVSSLGSSDKCSAITMLRLTIIISS